MSVFITPETIRAIQARGREPGGHGKEPPPRSQSCKRCGATFRWEKADGGYVMCLVTPSDTCDCGYGQAGSGGEDPQV